MLAFDAWCQAMEHTCQGKIVLSNLLHDYREQRLPQDLMRQFLCIVAQKWQDVCAADAVATAQTTAPHPHQCPLCHGTWTCTAVLCQSALEYHCTACLAHVRAIELIPFIAKREQPDAYICKGREPLPNHQGCSRIMLAKDFIRDHINPSYTGWIEHDDDGSTDVAMAHITELERGLVQNVLQEEKFPATSLIGWVTKTEALEGLCPHAGDETRADIIRERLGLIHYSGGFHVLEVVYPADALHTTLLAPPTFLDGTPYKVYRSRKNPDGWGRTVDLSTGKDGLPEAVHWPVDFTEYFVVRYMGKLSHTFPQADCQCEEVLGAASHQWQHTDVATLEELINGQCTPDPAA